MTAQLVQIKNLAQKGLVLKSIVQVKGFVPHQSLLRTNEVHRNIERHFLCTRRKLHVGGFPFKPYAHAVVAHPVHRQSGGYFSLTVVILPEQLPVVSLGKFEVQVAYHRRIVEAGRRFVSGEEHTPVCA